LSHQVDAEDLNTYFFYDAMGRLTCQKQGVGTSDERSYKMLAYNEFGQIINYYSAKADSDNDCAPEINTPHVTDVIYNDYGQQWQTIFPPENPAQPNVRTTETITYYS